ncbi:mas-related G-protein coupled receptor member X1-like [Marmota marmota marmota]|uniref:mas-related G-protein coupled receptor member X1-like n=1 Tax=Marmota marmota marmota TaxID=9994 RepID=UPI0007623A02|nr:mas-related G-protein coupled receptor member X1-like [Marmota marmota marmota]
MTFAPEYWGSAIAFLEEDSIIKEMKTESTSISGSYKDLPSICDNNNLIEKVLTIIISLVGLTGNASVIWFLGVRMHRNAFYTYILNLAAADFLYLCFHITEVLTEVIEIILPIHIPTYGIIRTGAIIFYIAGLSMLGAISTVRCLSVLWPIWYRCHRPRHTSTVMCALLWGLSMFLSTLERSCFSYFNKTVAPCKKVEFTITAWLVILFVILSGSSLALLGRMLCGSQRKPLTRLYVTILLTELVFLFCGLLFGVRLFLLVWIQNDSNMFTCLHLVSSVLSCVNSSANPIIYFFVGSYRQRVQGQNLKLVLERALQDTPEEGECGGSLSRGTLEMSGGRVEQG